MERVFLCGHLRVFFFVYHTSNCTQQDPGCASFGLRLCSGKKKRVEEVNVELRILNECYQTKMA
jgi:hypothetical protein